MQTSLSNKEVGGVFKTLSALMELHGENPYKIKSYSNAAFQIGRLPDKVWEMDLQTLEATKGVGKSVAARIEELRSTGEIPLLIDLMERTPPGVIDMLKIKGLGAKKIGQIWKELGVESTGELLYACNENRLTSMKGFGEKTQTRVIEAIEYFQSNKGKAHYAVADAEALLLESEWITSGVAQPKRTGGLRRKEIVIDALEWIIWQEEQKAFFKSWPLVESEGEDFVGKSVNGLEIKIYWSEQLAKDQFLRTGNQDHITHMKSMKGFSDEHPNEEAIYKSVGLPYIIPELREDLAEWDLAANGNFKDLVEVKDIKGVVHNHSTWSDGRNSIREMAEACIEKGFEYLVMSDHSKSAFYANGLQEDRVKQQHLEIDALNTLLAPFKIFKSIESDILYDGALDYSDELLKSFDLVIASIHSQLRMPEEKAMERLIAAIKHPATNILGHMTGRLLLSRPEYPINHKLIIDTCAKHKVAIEINANPYRLDMDYHWLPYAQEQGVLISINPDAHSIEGIDDIKYGVFAAQKGGLLKQNTLNACTLNEFNNWLIGR